MKKCNEKEALGKQKGAETQDPLKPASTPSWMSMKNKKKKSEENLYLPKLQTWSRIPSDLEDLKSQ